MQKDQWLELLRDVAAFNDYRKANPKEAVDLAGADLTGAQLVHANLGDADLQAATLANANLYKANLNGANLRGANLQGADLNDTTLHRAELAGADLRGAKVGGLVGDGRICLHPSCFEGVTYDKAHLEAVLDVLNRNSLWQIRYELVPKSTTACEGRRFVAGPARSVQWTGQAELLRTGLPCRLNFSSASCACWPRRPSSAA